MITVGIILIIFLVVQLILMKLFFEAFEDGIQRILNNVREINKNVGDLTNTVIQPTEPDLTTQTEQYLQSLPGSPTRR